jgi:hypothetical protein
MYTVNAVPHLALGFQFLGAISAAITVSGVLSFTYDTFLRPGVSVGNTRLTFLMSIIFMGHP